MGYISTWEMLFFFGLGFHCLSRVTCGWNKLKCMRVAFSVCFAVSSCCFFFLHLFSPCCCFICVELWYSHSMFLHFALLIIIFLFCDCSITSFDFQLIQFAFILEYPFFAETFLFVSHFIILLFGPFLFYFFGSLRKERKKTFVCVCKEWMFKTKAVHRRPTKSSEMYESDRMYCCLAVFKRVPSI